MMVTDYRRWRRTKIWVATALFLIAVASAGGFESQDGITPMPSFALFCGAMFCLTWLTININRRK